MKDGKYITAVDAEARWRLTGDSDESDASWGDPWLDGAVGPLQVGSIYTFAARKGTGKSFGLLRQLLLLPAGTQSLYVSLEDPMREMGRRIAASDAPVGRKDAVLVAVPERPKLSTVVKLMAESRARVVAIDYLQVLQDDSKVSTFDRAGQVRNVVTELKATARQHGQSVLLAAQLRRPAQGGGSYDASDTFEEDEAPKEPRGTIFEIRDSSDVENQSEAVILIHRLGRKFFDQTVACAKSRMGGERRKFERGPGGWPVPVEKTGNGLDSSHRSVQDTWEGPFA